MKAIGDLGRLWRPRCGTAGIVLGPVAGNDFDAWMVVQPRRDGLGRTLRQEIHGPTSFEIDQDGAIDPPFSHREIIDTENPWYGP